MIIEQIWIGNALRNFNYLIACPETGAALAIDPLDHQKCLEIANSNGWQISQVVNTHHHADHIGGNGPMLEATGAKLLAHEKASPHIPGIDHGLRAGDVVRVGKSVELRVLDTPGHTMSHICLLSMTDTAAVISGDTLFNAGAGNCRHGGSPDELFKTFVTQLFDLPEQTRVYPGHDYMVHNLRFTLDREPENVRARGLLDALQKSYDPNKPFVSTIGVEREINTFFRLTSRNVVDRLRESFLEMSENPTPKEVFLGLRELRNHW